MVKQITKRTCFFCLSIVFFFAFMACSMHERKPFYEADISGIHLDDIPISQYEEVLFNANPFILSEELEPHLEEFGFFLGEGIIEPEGQQQLYDYVTDPFLIELYLDSRERWESLKELKKALTRAFRFYKYHFPDETIPRVYSYVSGIDYIMPVKYANGHMVIALDTYLGPDYPNYDKIGLPKYQSQQMRPEKVPVDAMRILAEKHLAKASHIPENLLEHMIYQGKKQFFLDCMLPRTPDSLKISYTARQLSWMQENEGPVWAYKLDNELLYSTEHGVIQQFLRDAPFTSPFSRQSAPRTGVYLGWQIVREYMQRNPDVDLQELINESDAREILAGARYRPR